MYTADGKGIYLTKGGHVFGSVKKSFHRYDLEKKEMQTLFNTSYTTQFTPSPDNNWIAFSELYKVYIANARIITMEDDYVIENGTVIVSDNKITHVSEGDIKIKIPKDATTIDLNHVENSDSK